MINVNVVGRLGQDAELKEGKNGQFIKFALATSELRNENGEYPTTWINVTYDNTNPNLLKTLTKGRLVNIMGRLNPPSIYTTRDGENKVSLDVRAHNLDFVSVGSGSTSTQSEGHKVEETVTTGSFTKTPSAVSAPPPTPQGTSLDVEDDLPF